MIKSDVCESVLMLENSCHNR